MTQFIREQPADPSDEAKVESVWIGIGFLVGLTAATVGYVIWVLREL